MNQKARVKRLAMYHFKKRVNFFVNFYFHSGIKLFLNIFTSLSSFNQKATGQYFKKLSIFVYTFANPLAVLREKIEVGLTNGLTANGF